MGRPTLSDAMADSDGVAAPGRRHRFRRRQQFRLRDARSNGAGRRLGRRRQQCRQRAAVRTEPQDNPCRARDACGFGGATRLENTHGTGFRELLYRWHPWFGLRVCVHGTIGKAGGVAFRCTLSGSDADRWLEIPAWMFDRAACQATLTTSPFVDMAALSTLRNLLAEVLKAHPVSSNVAFSDASWTSRDQDRGEAHVGEDSVVPDVGTAKPDKSRSAAQSRADASVRKRPVRHRGRCAGVAGTAAGDAACADQADGAAACGACGQKPDGSNDGGRS